MPPRTGASSNMAAVNRRKSETASKINNFLLKLKAAGLNVYPYNLPENQCSVNTDLCLGIGFPEI